MSMIKDNQRLAFAVFPGPEHTLELAIIRLIGEIQDGYRKEQQENWSEEDKLRAEGVRATCRTFQELLDSRRDHEVNNG